MKTAPLRFAYVCAWTCKLSSRSCRRNIAPPLPKPRGGLHRRWRGERSEPVKLGVYDHHGRSLCTESPAQSEQWCCRIGGSRIISGSGEIAVICAVSAMSLDATKSARQRLLEIVTVSSTSCVSPAPQLTRE